MSQIYWLASQIKNKNWVLHKDVLEQYIFYFKGNCFSEKQNKTPKTTDQVDSVV